MDVGGAAAGFTLRPPQRLNPNEQRHRDANTPLGGALSDLTLPSPHSAVRFWCSSPQDGPCTNMARRINVVIIVAGVGEHLAPGWPAKAMTKAAARKSFI